MYVCVHVSPLTELYIMVQDKHPFIFFFLHDTRNEENFIVTYL